MSLRGPSDNPYENEAEGRVVGVGNGTGGFNLQAVFCLFEILKMFYPPEGLCRAEPERGPIVFYLCFIGVGNDTGGFNLQTVCCLFETLKMFYPPKGRLLADSCRGPIVFTYVLFWVSKTLEAFQFRDGFLPF